MVEAQITLPELEEVRLAGAAPSARLLTFIEQTVGTPVRGVYGSTEGGGVSQVWYEPRTDRFDVGIPLPDVDLQVVDADGHELPAGTEGAVRYRTPGLVSGYLVGGAVEPLPDGWFTPGDRGSLTATGSLVLAGRDSELLNIGGVKVDPARLDDLAAGFPGVRDAAAFGLERHAGIPEVGLAVVTEEGCDLRALDRELRDRMPVGHPTAYWRLDAIPRSRLGKALRAKLTEDYERALSRRG
jgi:acyl-CoA synthetase (AMP-forming)/AMP-acid ligase II